MRAWVAVTAMIGASCAGTLSEPVPAPPPPAAAPARPGAGPAPAGYLRGGVRRLTRMELRQTLRDLVGLDFAAELAQFPEEHAEANDVFAFDNNYPLQQPSAALIEAVRALAQVASERLSGDAALRAGMLPCTPKQETDAACLRQFVTAFGRRALRRALGAAEVEELTSAALRSASEARDFGRGVALVVRALLQDMEFLYRIELGAPAPGAPGLRRLTGYEVASRLSYFLWGTMPDERLLAEAESGDRLQTRAAVRVAALRMLDDRRARDAVARFHAMWLGYDRQPPAGELRDAMLAESRALVDRVVWGEKRSWLDLFRMRESYLDGALAAHYGLPQPDRGPAWVPYAGSGRQGILSHATFLGVERKHGDTSPTMRGAFVRARLLCEELAPPPPTVNTDTPPRAGACKQDRYGMWKTEGCRFCHGRMDPIGLGLENYDRFGRFRKVAPDDSGKAGCQIAGHGELVTDDARESFQGVAGLSDRLVASGALESCVARQLAHQFLGRQLRDDEAPVLETLTRRFRAGGHRFDDMMLALVTSPAFGYRLPE